ncbi:MAG: type I-E CRISPR-associated protein Cas5/CasD, partial [Cellvibrionaceae bacterium]|nr:type I-E CRISPR-associated protein Cas5/CasD [Cellvibrionaceae bacterium]
MDYLVFRLYGAMASWGQPAVGETRHSGTYPSKSAVTGLLGAALGIKRSQEQALAQLAGSYHQACKVINGGHLLRDYHTTQVPDSTGKLNYATRRDELIKGKARLGTILSGREYLCDSQALIALKDIGSNWTLDDIRQALLKPKFQLYLGRKSHPLCAPMEPKIITAAGFRAALDSHPTNKLICSTAAAKLPDWKTDERWLPEDAQAQYYWEGELNSFSDNTDGFCAQQ